MARAQIESDGAAVMQALSDSMGDPAAEPERVGIRTLVALFGKRRRVRRAAIEALVAAGLGHERAKSVQTVAEMLAARSDRLLPERALLSAAAIFVITRAVNGVLRATMEEESPHPGTREFEDELVRLVRGDLAAPGP